MCVYRLIGPNQRFHAASRSVQVARTAGPTLPCAELFWPPEPTNRIGELSRGTDSRHPGRQG